MTHAAVRTRSRTARPPAVAIACLLTIAAAVVFAHEGHVPLPSKGAQVDVARGHITLSADARTALDVRAVEIGTASPPDTIPAYVTLVTPWKGHAFAASRLPGRVVALHAKPGERVEAGAVLAEVQSQELETLRLEIQTARTEARLAEQVYEVIKASAGAVPEQDSIDAEVRLQQARNALELAGVKWVALGLPPAALAALLAGVATPTPGLPVRTPVGGTVVHADIAVGKVVEPGEHLFEIIDLSTVWARVGVLEKDIPRVRPGLPVEVRLTAYPGEAFRGTIAVVGHYLDPVTHLNDVWIEFRNPVSGVKIEELRLKIDHPEQKHPTPGFPSAIFDQQSKMLLPGMSGRARIELPAAAGTKTVPFTALVDDGVDRFVLVEEASAAGVSEYRRKSVVVVRETPDLVEVRSPDLFPGDRVVTRGGHELGAFFAPGVLRLSPESARSIGLAVEPAAAHAVETVVEVPGAVDLPPGRRSVAAARLPGAISSINTDRGRRVEAGDVLAEVFSLELLNLQLDLLREHLAADLAGRQLAQFKQAKGVVPTRRLVEAEAAAAAAAGKRDSLRRRLELAGLTADRLDALLGLPIEDRRLKNEVGKAPLETGPRLSAIQSSIFNRRSPILIPTLPVRAAAAGTVVSFDRVIGQSVRADESLFEVHDSAGPWIQGFVSEQELSRVRVGQPARVRLVGGPGVVLSGKVARSGRAFGAADRTLSVWVELDRDPPAPLRHGQMARLTLTVETRPPALAVPVAAVVREGTRAFVFVRSGDTFDRREVALGRTDDRFAEVTAGLAAGDPVAVAGAAALNTGWHSLK